MIRIAELTLGHPARKRTLPTSAMGQIWPFRIRGECRLSGGALESAFGSVADADPAPVSAVAGSFAERLFWVGRRARAGGPGV